jgi:hypothetical protein
MNLTAQFFISKFDIASLVKISLPIRVLILSIFLWSVQVLSNTSSGFTTGPTLCMFRNVTGLPCPFCGTTRSIGHILIGNFESALRLNPLGYISLMFFVFLIVKPLTIKKLSSYIAEKWWNLTQRNQISITLSMLASTWALNLPRLI